MRLWNIRHSIMLYLYRCLLIQHIACTHRSLRLWVAHSLFWTCSFRFLTGKIISHYEVAWLFGEACFKQPMLIMQFRYSSLLKPGPQIEIDLTMQTFCYRLWKTSLQYSKTYAIKHPSPSLLILVVWLWWLFATVAIQRTLMKTINPMPLDAKSLNVNAESENNFILPLVLTSDITVEKFLRRHWHNHVPCSFVKQYKLT